MSIIGMPCIFKCKRVREPDMELETVEIIAENKTTALIQLEKRYFLKSNERWEIDLKRRLRAHEVPRDWVR